MCNRTLRAPRLQLVVVTTSDLSTDQVSGVSRCFVYNRRITPAPTLTFGDDDTSPEQTRKRARLSADDASTVNEPSAEEDYRQLYCRHRVKLVCQLLPRQDGHLVALTHISRYRDVAFAGVTCAVVVTWSDGGDSRSNSVSRTCGHISLSARDVVSPQFNLLFNTSSVPSGL